MAPVCSAAEAAPTFLALLFPGVLPRAVPAPAAPPPPPAPSVPASASPTSPFRAPAVFLPAAALFEAAFLPPGSFPAAVLPAGASSAAALPATVVPSGTPAPSAAAAVREVPGAREVPALFPAAVLAVAGVTARPAGFAAPAAPPPRVLFLAPTSSAVPPEAPVELPDADCCTAVFFATMAAAPYTSGDLARESCWDDKST
ncbi:hypothetical protein [Streptomyces sp. NPDC003401]